MREALRHEQLTMVGSAQDKSLPLAESRRTFADVHHNIVDRAGCAADEFGLGFGVELIVKTAEDTRLYGKGMIVLNEAMLDAILMKPGFVIAFDKKAPVISMNGWLNKFQPWQLRLVNVQENTILSLLLTA